MQIQNLIVGCGLSGAVVARELAKRNQEVLIIDKRSHIGGNVYDYKDEKSGISVHKYGPHVFHTSIKEVWDYLSQFTKWHYFYYRVKAFIDGKEVNVPFNLDSLHKVFPEFLANKLERKLVDSFGFNKKVPILELLKSKNKDLEFLASYVYEKVFLGYTSKQWGVKPEELDFSVSARVPVYVSRDDGYFQDTYQAIPLNGYTQMVQNIIDHQNIQVRLNTEFADIKDEISYQRLIFTGAIDEFFGYEFGKLPYRSLDIVFERYEKEFKQSAPQINYPCNYNFTRSVEYKYYLDEKSAQTILSYEYPCEFKDGQNERYYPIPDEKNETLYQKYRAKARERGFENVFFLGRLGDYRYYDMDKCVARALEFCKELLG